MIRQSIIVEFPKKLMTSSAIFAKSLMYRIALPSPFVDKQKHAMIIQKNAAREIRFHVFRLVW